MKAKMILMLVTSFLVVGSNGYANTTARKSIEIRSVNQQPNLKIILDAMVELAEVNGSIEHFSYTESFKDFRTNCASISTRTIVENFEYLVNQLDVVGAEMASKPQVEEALKEFKEVLGKGKYRVCYRKNSQNRSYTTIDQYIGPDYKIQFTVGSED